MKINLNQPASNPLPPTDRPLRSNQGNIDAQQAAGSGKLDTGVQNTRVDSAEFSVRAAELGRLAGMASSAPDVRQGRIEALRDSIVQGTYEVSPERIADAMLAQATKKAR